MNIVDIVRDKISNNPVEFHNLNCKGITITFKSNYLCFEKLSSINQHIHKIITFMNEDDNCEECICLYHKNILGNNVGFIKKTDFEFECEPVATVFSECLSDDLKDILKILNIQMVEKKISFYNSSANTVVKLIIKNDYSNVF